MATDATKDAASGRAARPGGTDHVSSGPPYVPVVVGGGSVVVGGGGAVVGGGGAVVVVGAEVDVFFFSFSGFSGIGGGPW
jgi:hypothetical protein